MAAISDYLEERLLSFLFKGNAAGLATPGDGLYLAAFTSGVDLEAGSLAGEVVGGSYARVQVVAADWTITVDPRAENAVAIEFPAATDAWGIITHAAITDAASGGNILMHGVLSQGRSIQSGDQLRFPIGEVRFTLG